jgi:hypothetical protein
MRGKMVNPTRLLCQRCNHEWSYTGKRSYFVTCPNCRTSVSIQKHQMIGSRKDDNSD